MSDERDKTSRREIVGAVGVALGACVVGGAARAVHGGGTPGVVRGGEDLRALVPKPNPPAPGIERAAADGEVARFFGELGPGARVGTCTIVSVHAPVAGAIPVVLTTSSGRTFQVDVLRRATNDEKTKTSLAATSTLEVSLCNGGDGEHATDEEQGLAARALAEALHRREAAGAKPPDLLTLREREARFTSDALRLRV